MNCDRLVLEVEIMSGLIEFLTTEEMIMVYVLVGIASVLYFIIYFLDKTAMRRKQRQNTRELEKIVLEDSQNLEPVPEVKVNPQESVLFPTGTEENQEEVVLLDVEDTPSVSENLSVSQTSVEFEVSKTDVMPQQEVMEEEPVITPVNQVVEEQLQYTSIEPDPSEAQAELMRLTETLEKAEKEVKNIDLTAFEEEQEQNAIISLDELMSRNKVLYERGELEKLEDEGNEPISLQDLEQRMKSVQSETQATNSLSFTEVVEPILEPKQMALDDFQTVSISNEQSINTDSHSVYSEHKKFKSSPVISPVFGIEKPLTSTASDIELENTANYDKLDEEIRKTNEFLMTLKELQQKLD